MAKQSYLTNYTFLTAEPYHGKILKNILEELIIDEGKTIDAFLDEDKVIDIAIDILPSKSTSRDIYAKSCLKDIMALKWLKAVVLEGKVWYFLRLADETEEQFSRRFSKAQEKFQRYHKGRSALSETHEFQAHEALIKKRQRQVDDLVEIVGVIDSEYRAVEQVYLNTYAKTLIKSQQAFITLKMSLNEQLKREMQLIAQFSTKGIGPTTNSEDISPADYQFLQTLKARTSKSIEELDIKIGAAERLITLARTPEKIAEKMPMAAKILEQKKVILKRLAERREQLASTQSAMDEFIEKNIENITQLVNNPKPMEL